MATAATLTVTKATTAMVIVGWTIKFSSLEIFQYFKTIELST